MADSLGALSKTALRVGSDQGMTGSAVYPTTEATADTEEMLLKFSDQLSFVSEGVVEERRHELDETMVGTPATTDTDETAIMGGGPLELNAFYDGLDQLIACAMGFEKPDPDGSPVAQNSTALTQSASVGNSVWDDTGTPFVAGDVGKFIKVNDTGSVAGSSVRRISAFTDTNTVTITPDWNNPARGNGASPVAADTAVMDTEWLHTFECSNNLNKELWTDVYATYATTGIQAATDDIIRFATLGILKFSTTPWIWRAVMVNSITFRFAAGEGMTVSVELIPFNLDRASATNGAASAADWDFDHSSAVFEPNERIVFSDIDHFRIDDFSTSVSLSSADDQGISAFEMTINNNLKGDDMDAVSGKFRVEPTRSAHREITGSITLPRYNADTFFEWEAADDKLMAHLQATGSTITANARKFEIFINSLKLEAGQASISGAGVTQQTFNFRALAPTGQASGFPTHTTGLTTPRSEVFVRTLNQNPFSAFLDQQQEY
jgi:hypothetical protein